MSLQHELRCACPGIPELHAAILGSRQHPVRVRGERNRENKVTVALKRLDALATLRARLVSLTRGAELPHLDSPVETARDEILAVGRESDRVHTILVAVRTFETLNEEARVNVPDTHALIEGACGNKLGVRRDGDSSNAVFYRESESVATLLNIPQANSPVATARGNCPSVASKVQRVNILLVAREVVANRSGLDVPDLCSKLVFSLVEWRRVLIEYLHE